MENEIPIDYTLTIDGDKLKGKGRSDFGGQRTEFDIEGKREKKDKYGGDGIEGSDNAKGYVSPSVCLRP